MSISIKTTHHLSALENTPSQTNLDNRMSSRRFDEASMEDTPSQTIPRAIQYLSGNIIDNPMSSRRFDEASMEDAPSETTPRAIQYLFEVNREDYLNYGVPLYEASLSGNWDAAKLILDARPGLVRFGLCKELGTALHIAVTAEETTLTLRFVNNLVEMISVEELEIMNMYSNTAFHLAILMGRLEMAIIMVRKNPRLPNIHGNTDPRLPNIRGNTAELPLTSNTHRGTSKSLKYMYNNFGKMTGDAWTEWDREVTLLRCMEREFFDVALQIVNDYPELLEDVSLLNVLARKPDAFSSRVKKNFISRIIIQIFRFTAEEDTDALKLLKIFWTHATRTMYLHEIEVKLKKSPTLMVDYSTEYSSGILFAAAEMGNTRFIIELLRTYPDLMFLKDKDGLTIFHIAVKNRQHGIYNLLYEIGVAMKDDICIIFDYSGNNMLHLVGKTSKEMTAKNSGASLLMQRELLWFKDIEKMMPSNHTERKNKDGQTPYELFSKENNDLLSKGLKWMRDCMVVATLIITVAFAVAFTVPGGYNQNNGLPIFINDRSFILFIIANSISLFASTTSLFVFLSIVISRQEQRDFMYSLPRKLMMGLLTLFISVVAMMITFSASFFVLYRNGLDWVPTLIATFASIPVFVFAISQFPLLLDMFRSTYDSRYIFNPKSCMLYNTNQRLRSNCSSPELAC